MSEPVYSVVSLTLLAAMVGGFLAAAVTRLHIGLRLQGVRDLSLGALLQTSSTSFADARQNVAAYQAARADAFRPGSELDPDLRRLYVRERRLSRAAWTSLAALVASTAWSPGA